mgnify:CR=1 FL=1
MIKNGFTWYLLLTKRLLKKPSFWAVLLLVPVMVFGLGLAAQEESHILRIAVYAVPYLYIGTIVNTCSINIHAFISAISVAALCTD